MKSKKTYWFISYFACDKYNRKALKSSFLSAECPVFILKDVTNFLCESNGYTNCVVTNYKEIDEETYNANL